MLREKSESPNEVVLRTNIHCSSCVLGLKDRLNTLAGEGNWSIDMNHSDKPLKITNPLADLELIESFMKDSGYKTERI